MAYDPPSTIDPDGRRVVFDAGSHLHLAAKRPWLLDEIDTILDTIAHPALHVLDRERYYRENPFPDGWLRVVVDYSEEPAWIVTAVCRTMIPVDNEMTITIAGIDFDYRDYDERSDVLYLHVGPPKAPPAKTLETPEGHTVEYDDHGAIIGLELMGVRGMLDRNEELQLTWPPAHLAASALRQALAA